MQFNWMSPKATIDPTVARELGAKIAALDLSLAIIEFNMDGSILSANGNFLKTMGYTLSDIVNQHHRIFLDPEDSQTADYMQFWSTLNRGEFVSGVFKRRAKDGSIRYLEASYNPIMGPNNTPTRVIKFASDVTAWMKEKERNTSFTAALNRSQAVIHFALDGTILDANQLFLDTVGYRIDQIRGKHHSMFVASAYAASPEYRAFWDQLNRGDFVAGQFKRRRADGKEIWLEASYNPILDRSGRPIRVTKFAADVTKQMEESSSSDGQLRAILSTQAVIHFKLDGTILWANDNFLRTMNYTIDQIRGQHHRLFVEPEYSRSDAYAAFWDGLRAGKVQEGEFLRFGAGGKHVWIQAAYTPIVDRDGKICKVVKFAYDITPQVSARLEGQNSLNSALETILTAVTAVNQKSVAASNSSNDTLSMVQAVASASEELSASIREIAQSMVKSKNSVDEVMHEANSADDSTNRLGAKANSMTQVVELIQEIAEQINLLSLNAAIESARAGDAGRGFAVVASEVKSLANQVQAATADISKKIFSMQSVSSEVVEALAVIKSSIHEVHDAVSVTASAVEEQSAVTSEISSNMLTATGSVGRINSSISEVLHAVEHANECASEGKATYAKLIGS